MSKSDENKTLDELKGKLNTLDYEVLNVTVFQNLSSAQNEGHDISDFPIIHQTNGTTLRLKCNQNILSNYCVLTIPTYFKFFNIFFFCFRTFCRRTCLLSAWCSMCGS